MTQKMVITKPGYDATNGTISDKNKIFDSSLDHLKTAVSGSLIGTIAASGVATGTVSHGLGYHPLSMCYFTDTSTNFYKISMSYSPQIGGSRSSISDVNVSMYCGTANTYFEFHNYTATSKTITVDYEIFYEGA